LTTGCLGSGKIPNARCIGANLTSSFDGSDRDAKQLSPELEAANSADDGSRDIDCNETCNESADADKVLEEQMETKALCHFCSSDKLAHLNLNSQCLATQGGTFTVKTKASSSRETTACASGMLIS
jgi:hypothetical protein